MKNFKSPAQNDGSYSALSEALKENSSFVEENILI